MGRFRLLAPSSFAAPMATPMAAPGMTLAVTLTVVLAVTLAARPLAAQPPTRAAASTLYQEVAKALEEPRDPRLALERLQGRPRLVEADPGLQYLLARALLQLGRKAEARAALRRVEAMDRGFEAAQDPEFRALRPPRRGEAPAGHPREIARVNVPDLFPEGLAVAGNRTFLSSLRHGGVLELQPGRPPRWFTAPAAEGPWATLGLKVDAPRRLLWMASNGKPGRAGRPAQAPEAWGLFAVDLDRGAVVRRALLPPGGTHLLNDLTLAPDGTVYATDSRAGAVWRLRPGAEVLEALVPPGQLPETNGLVFTRDGKGLLVAGSHPGLYRVDFDDPRPRPLAVPPGMHLQGIDGLSRVGNHLVAVQNAFLPGRVAWLTLDETETALVGLRLLAAGQPELRGIPTTGDIVGDVVGDIVGDVAEGAAGNTFRFIANSQLMASEGTGPGGPVHVMAVDLPR